MIKTKESEVKIIDFGLSDFHNKEGNYLYTRCGTPGFVDLKVDLYALGLILYLMVTGRPPFKAVD